jgi:hypothetical protein
MSNVYFAIIEVEDGMTIVECENRESLEAVAIAHHGVIVDPGPFRSYDDAYDELTNLEAEDDDMVDS